jgi:protein-disulfide isomerase
MNRSTRAALVSFSLAAGRILCDPPASAQTPATCAAPCPSPSLAGSPSPTPAPAPVRPSDVKSGAGPAEIDAAVDQASARGDREGVARHLDAGMVAVDGFSGSVQTREELLKQISPPSALSQYKTTESEVVVKTLGELAVVTSKKTDSWIFEGRPDSRSYRETNTFVRRGDAWKMILSAHTDEPPAYSPKDVVFDVPFDAAAVLGDPKASVVLVEFGDYECEMCRMFAKETMGRIEKDYVQTGKVAVLFRDHPLSGHKRAFPAAAAGRCASDAGKRWPMSERLLKDPVALSDEDFRKSAREIGLDLAAFEKCVADPATAKKIREGVSEDLDMDVKGTPMFLVGIHRPGEARVRGIRMVEGAVPYGVFRATLDGLLRAVGR